MEWRVLAGGAMSLAMCLLGVALASNFRGVTEWHVQRSVSTASVLRRVPRGAGYLMPRTMSG